MSGCKAGEQEVIWVALAASSGLPRCFGQRCHCSLHQHCWYVYMSLNRKRMRYTWNKELLLTPTRRATVHLELACDDHVIVMSAKHVGTLVHTRLLPFVPRPSHPSVCHLQYITQQTLGWESLDEPTGLGLQQFLSPVVALSFQMTIVSWWLLHVEQLWLGSTAVPSQICRGLESYLQHSQMLLSSCAGVVEWTLTLSSSGRKLTICNYTKNLYFSTVCSLCEAQ